jgi:hypothetical protein
MSFLAPSWLGIAVLGFLAASIPIIIHFLFKTRYRVVAWAAMQFLRKSLEKTTRRIKFQELLLLLIRIGLLVLLTIALMRPSSTRHSGQAGAPVDAVFIFDTSGSMAIEEDGASRLEWAKRAAQKVVATLPRHSTLHILRADRLAEDLGPASATNYDQARYVIEQLEQTHAPASLLDAFKKTKDIWNRGVLANKEVYLFGDMQRQDWDQDSHGIAAACEELQQLGELILVRAGQGTIPANATLSSLRPQLSLPMLEERLPFTAEVRNTGTTELQGMTVTLRNNTTDRDVDTQPVPPLKPGQAAAVTLTTRLQKQGKNIITAELQGDRLSIDNRVDYLLQTQDQVKILVVDGQRNEADPAQAASYYLAHALRAAKQSKRQDKNDPVQLTIVSKSAAHSALLADAQICFLVGLSDDQSPLPDEFLNRLTKFVQSGGGVVVFGGNGRYSSGLEKWPGLPCQLGTRIEHPEQNPLRFDLQSIPVNSFLSAFRQAPLSGLVQTEITKGTQLVGPRADAQTPLKYADGQNAIVVGPYGRGSVVVVSFAADLRGSDAPLRPSYVPFIQALVGHMLSQRLGRQNLVAGETYFWRPPPELRKQRFRLLTPSGAIRPLELPKSDDLDGEVATGELGQAGVYRILPDVASSEETGSDTSDSGDIFVVTPDPRETADLTTLNEEQLNERLSRPPIHQQASGLMVGELDRSRVQHEWTEVVLWVLLVVGILELSFAWFCNRAL